MDVLLPKHDMPNIAGGNDESRGNLKTRPLNTLNKITPPPLVLDALESFKTQRLPQTFLG